MRKIKKIFTAINTYFIADEGEYIPLSDYIAFYGFIVVSLPFILFFGTNAIKIILTWF